MKHLCSVGLVLLAAVILTLGGAGCTGSPEKRTSSYEKSKTSNKSSRAPYQREGSGSYGY